jgi:hypothetical protein
MSVTGITIFAIWAFVRSQMMRDEIRIDSGGILEGSRYRSML